MAYRDAAPLCCGTRTPYFWKSASGRTCLLHTPQGEDGSKHTPEVSLCTKTKNQHHKLDRCILFISTIFRGPDAWQHLNTNLVKTPSHPFRSSHQETLP
jgi:hypothetical protein